MVLIEIKISILSIVIRQGVSTRTANLNPQRPASETSGRTLMTCRTPQLNSTTEQSAPRGTSCRNEMIGNRQGSSGHMYPDKNRVRVLLFSDLPTFNTDKVVNHDFYSESKHQCMVHPAVYA